MYVKPATDPATEKHLVVRFPRTHALLPPEGGEVPQTQFWLRRLAHGDVVRAMPPVPAQAPAQHTEE